MKYFLLAVIILLSSSPFALSAGPGLVQLPEGLKITYDKFVLSMKSGDSGNINKYCLPDSADFSYQARKDPEYGKDINVIFAKNNFDGTILSVRKDADNCYLIRTNTTALWFVETKSAGWKLYSYLDKPMQ